MAVLVDAQSINKSGREQRNRRSLGRALRAILPLRRSVVLPKKLLCSRKAAMLRRPGQIQSTEPKRVTTARKRPPPISNRIQVSQSKPYIP